MVRPLRGSATKLMPRLRTLSMALGVLLVHVLRVPSPLTCAGAFLVESIKRVDRHLQ